MTAFKMLLLLIVITMLNHRGIIYRSGVKKPAIPYRERAEIARDRNLSGTWRLSGVSEMDDAMILDPSGRPYLRTSGKQELLISFFEDSTFTQIRANGAYDLGRWAFDEKTSSLFLTSERKTQEVGVGFEVAASGSRLITLDFSPGNSLILMEQDRRMGNFKEDPFYYANNKWRIKPATPENRAEIVARLTNYVRHNACILKAADMRNQQTISWEFSEGIIRLYNVGIGVVKPDQIPDAWYEGFYSKENAMEARRIFEDYLLRAKHPLHNTGNWVRDDYSILLDIHNGLRKW